MGVFFRSSKHVVAAYNTGFHGSWKDADARARLFDQGHIIPASEWQPKAYGPGLDVDVVLTHAVQRHDPGIFGSEEERQTRGSCASHAARMAMTLTRCADLRLHRDPERYYKRAATEPIYAARHGRGEGMSPAVAAEFVAKYGTLFREDYSGSLGFDLTHLNERYADPRYLTDAVRARCRDSVHSGKWWEITSIEDLAAALQNGCGVAFGFWRGWTTTPGRDGLMSYRGRWNHSQAIGDLFLSGRSLPKCARIINSWGDYCSMIPDSRWPKLLPPQPRGTFLVPLDHIEEIIEYGDIYAYAGAEGRTIAAAPLVDYSEKALMGILG